MAVCAAVSIGVIVYNRANCRLSPAAMRHIAERATNFVGLKDGHGDLVSLQAAKSSLGDRLVFINGMPTAENFATAYFGLGIRTYSSAIFNFAPASAMSFYNAVQHRDEKAVSQFVEQFLVPYGQIRDKQPGYAVSIVKAGVDIVGRSAGKVRPPLSSLASEEYAQLKELIAALGPQVPQVS
ncbi:MAG: dihydrodipicolinate synthase family protein [Devosia ginsengisoli]|nr:dihydrodipicolinate synthase family protein [Devosia ginsengisoli]MCR6670758.1 dihydrodipicolinate synthase family protein [Devosia ginsengisoli]